MFLPEWQKGMERCEWVLGAGTAGGTRDRAAAAQGAGKGPYAPQSPAQLLCQQEQASEN